MCLGGLSEKDVVDGNRSGVLSLLWRTIVHFKLGQLLSLDMLKKEIKDVEKATMRRNRNTFTTSTSTSTTTIIPPDSTLTDLLLIWSATVLNSFSSSSSTPITNFTTNFADGRALCLLIHYYHPGLLRRDEICTKTTVTLRVGGVEGAELKTGVSADMWEVAVKGEARNVRLAAKRMSELGGIPGMLGDFDSTCPPESKSITTCVAYLCSRLMESSAEIQATLTIQRAWRQKFGLIGLNQKVIAGLKIWRFWKVSEASERAL